jgi:hypothetical protein
MLTGIACSGQLFIQEFCGTGPIFCEPGVCTEGASQSDARTFDPSSVAPRRFANAHLHPWTEVHGYHQPVAPRQSKKVRCALRRTEGATHVD